MRFWDSRFVFVVLTGLVLPVVPLVPATGRAATLTVAMGGEDADGCGSKAAPCRSISRAIANAVPGDKIVVGPGHYGDLDADGTLGEPGEEISPNSIKVMVDIDKAVTVESVAGAAQTAIDCHGFGLAGVVISADGVVFGKARKGFTVTRCTTGVSVGKQANVTVSGVRAVRNRNSGFEVLGGGIVLRANIAEANDESGFTIGANGATVTACRATANAQNGFAIKGNGVVLKGDVASANRGTGFQFAGDGNALTNSVASGNAVGLSVVATTNMTITADSFFGNAETGVFVRSPNTAITKSNIFGNGSVGGNCGVTTAFGGTANLEKVCFGAPTGPGDDPADAICGSTIQIGEIIEKVINIAPKVPL